MTSNIVLVSGALIYFERALGAIEELIKHNEWPTKPKVIIATSGGAFVALHLCLMKDKISDTKILVTAKFGIRELINVILHGKCSNYNYVYNMYKKFLTPMVRSYGYNLDFDHLTLAEFYHLTGYLLIVNALDIDTVEQIQLDAFETPNVLLIHALMATSCLFPVLTAVNLLIGGKSRRLVDGGYANYCFVAAINSPSVKRLIPVIDYNKITCVRMLPQGGPSNETQIHPLINNFQFLMQVILAYKIKSDDMSLYRQNMYEIPFKLSGIINAKMTDSWCDEEREIGRKIVRSILSNR